MSIEMYFEDEVTPWFESEEHPTHDGFYQLRLPLTGIISHAHFEEDEWKTDGHPAHRNNPPFQWRGLRAEPVLISITPTNQRTSETYIYNLTVEQNREIVLRRTGTQRVRPIEVSRLGGLALDYAVSLAAGIDIAFDGYEVLCWDYESPCNSQLTNFSEACVDLREIEIFAPGARSGSSRDRQWEATYPKAGRFFKGKTSLEARMRAYVAKELGYTVKVPVIMCKASPKETSVKKCPLRIRFYFWEPQSIQDGEDREATNSPPEQKSDIPHQRVLRRVRKADAGGSKAS